MTLIKFNESSFNVIFSYETIVGLTIILFISLSLKIRRNRYENEWPVLGNYRTMNDYRESITEGYSKVTELLRRGLLIDS